MNMALSAARIFLSPMIFGSNDHLSSKMPWARLMSSAGKTLRVLGMSRPFCACQCKTFVVKGIVSFPPLIPSPFEKKIPREPVYVMDSESSRK